MWLSQELLNCLRIASMAPSPELTLVSVPVMDIAGQGQMNGAPQGKQGQPAMHELFCSCPTIAGAACPSLPQGKQGQPAMHELFCFCPCACSCLMIDES